MNGVCGWHVEQAEQVAVWTVRGASVNDPLTEVHGMNASSPPVCRFVLCVPSEPAGQWST
jgi:hypothetical protein